MLEAHEQVRKLAENLKKDRSVFDTLFEDLAEIFLPNRQGFLGDTTVGEEKFENVVSSAPSLARRGLSSAVSTMLRPAGRVWFNGRAKIEQLNTIPEIRLWLKETTRIMYAHMYDPSARMESNLAQCDDDLVTFGSGCVRVGWSRATKNLRFRCRPLNGVYFTSDALGQINGVIIREKWKLRQIIERFGEENLTKKMKSMLANRPTKLDEEFELLHAVMPVDDAARYGMKFKQPFVSLWISDKCKETLEVKGKDYFEYITPRWDVASGEVYGRSPAMVALNDARLHQAMTETMVDAGEKALNPPTWGYGDLITGPFDMRAGGFTSVDMTGMPGNHAPINPVNLGTIPDKIAEFSIRVEERIGQAFYRDILELPSAREGDLTATEINARLDQYMRQAAPVFARIEHNYNAPLVNRVREILTQENQLPERPAIVEDIEEQFNEDLVEFEYESPIKVARDKAEAMKIVEGVQVLGNFANLKPDVLDNLNADELMRKLGVMLDIPQEGFVPQDIVAQIREQRAKKVEMAEMAEMAGKAGPALAQLGNLVPNAAKAGLIQGGEGGGEGSFPINPDQIPFEDIQGLADAV